VHRILEQEGPVRDVLREFFRSLIVEFLNGEGKGCFMANTTAELAGRDEAIFKVCAANTRQQEAAFSGLLVRAQRAGEIPADRSVVQLARFLINTMNGLAVTESHARSEGIGGHRGSDAVRFGGVIFFISIRPIVPN